jgi:hypothetical protein
MDTHITARQFSNLWLAIEGEDEISITTDDGVELSLTVEEAAELAHQLKDLLTTRNAIYEAED